MRKTAGKTAISVQNVSKLYYKNAHRAHSIKDLASQLYKKIIHSGQNKQEEKKPFWALKNINLDIKAGEILGIVGNNGAGKSTLLKTIAQITPPTEGVIEMYGRFASMLEVGTGFHNDLSGRDNVFINGALLGMKRQEIAKHFDSIIDFSGLDSFVDTPLKYYSSGMQVRLAFAVAASLQPEILLIDEVLAVGDFAFQQKCLDKMAERSKQGITILFVSHQLESIKRLCTQCVYINGGQVQKLGETYDVVETYLAEQQLHKHSEHIVRTDVDKHVYFSNIKSAYNRTDFLFSEAIKINFSLTINNQFSKKIDVGYYILEGNNKTVFHSFKTYNLAILPTVLPIIETVVTVPSQTLMPSKYYFQFVIFDAETAEILDKPTQLLPISVKTDYQINDSTSSDGIYIESNWQVN
jgi:lipopolysaccharide transport system ATP-binding protein